ncbi:FG-GAP-like repeat-containing protein [Cellulosimicrobium cellulans]|uniref:FG-GAP-like repeat-containing protein n=1 Tax=Cellulosimicrobium cellulans TaxID=1710 RepID=UPI003810D9D3
MGEQTGLARSEVTRVFRVRRTGSFVAGVSAWATMAVGSVVVAPPSSGVEAAPAVTPAAVPRTAASSPVVGDDDAGQPVLEEVALEPDDALSGPVEEPDAATGEAVPFGGTATGDVASDVVLTAETAATGVVVVGVTWETGSAPSGLALEIRTRVSDEWSPWSALEADDAGGDAGDGAPPSGGRDGTEPYLAGEVDGVEVALRYSDGEGPVDPRLSVVGTSEPVESSDAASEGGTTGTDEPSTTIEESEGGDALDDEGLAAAELGDVTTVALDRGAPADRTASATSAVAGTSLAVAGAPRPTIYSRAQWGANEAISTWTPQIGKVAAATVHHTAGTNTYSSAQVPALIRGIYTYHTQSRGWGDIGYNFLVDKFGRVWEGRKGGVDRAVIAAHASGVNSVAFGVSFLGNYDTASVPTVAVDAAARVIAWKFGLHGVTAGSAVTIDGQRLQTVFGHREVGQTTCPGRYLFARMPELRTKVKALQGDTASRVYSRDLNADTFPDVVARTSSAVSLATASSAGWKPAATVGKGWNAGRTVAPGDWTGDGVPDLMLIDTGGRLWLYPGTAGGGWQTQRVIGGGWQALDLVVGGGHDWNGDGRPDLLARKKADGALYLYPSNGSGGFGTVRRIGSGWQTMNAVATIGRLSNGAPALVARRASDGTLLTYRGDGKGGFSGAATVLGTGWQGTTAIVGAGDVNDDGAADLVARDGAGRLILYVGNGSGGVRGASQIGGGWQVFSSVVSAGRTGRGQDLYAVRRSDGALLRYSYQGRGDFGRVVPTSLGGAGVVEAIAPGDWDGDGRADLMTRRSNGDLYLHPQSASGTFGAGRRIGAGWQGMDQVVGVGNFAGTGRPSLAVLDRSSGRILLYTGNGSGGFGATSVIATGAGNVDRIVAGGLWAGGLVPDLVTRTTSGDLQLRRGNGAGLLGPAARIGAGWGVYASLVGVGDLDGDGKPDVVGVRSDGSTVLYAGNGAGGFAGSRSFSTVPGAVS